MNLFSRGYIPVDTFTASALAVARVDYLEGDRVSAAAQLAKDYEKTYLDTALQDDLIATADKIQEILPGLFTTQPTTKNGLASACRSLITAITKYRPDGKRRPAFFRGAFFTKEKSPVQDKTAAALKQIVIYHLLLVNSRIPLSGNKKIA